MTTLRRAASERHHPRAALRDIGGSDAPVGRGRNGRVRGGGRAGVRRATDYWPNVLYDPREGHASRRRERAAPGAPGGVANGRRERAAARCTWGGVMHYVELDVNNLRRWLDGDIGGSNDGRRASTAAAGSTCPMDITGFVVYFSDRRGNHDLGATTRCDARRSTTPLTGGGSMPTTTIRDRRARLRGHHQHRREQRAERADALHGRRTATFTDVRGRATLGGRRQRRTRHAPDLRRRAAPAAGHRGCWRRGADDAALDRPTAATITARRPPVPTRRSTACARRRSIATSPASTAPSSSVAR